MQIIKMTNGSECPKKGDLVLIQGRGTAEQVEPYRVSHVKEIPDGAIEIILDRRRNVWFDWQMYLDERSWVTDCRLVLP